MDKIKCITFDKEAQDNLPEWVKDKMKKDRKEAQTKPELYTVLCAGLCDKCSVPKMQNSGNGIDEPLDPYLWCDDVCITIEPVPPEDQIKHCAYFKPCT